MITAWIRRVLQPSVEFPPLAPEAPFAVIGDVHGRMDLLEKLLRKLDPEMPKVLVGDMVDRGEASAQVLRFLAKSNDLVCLMGNHEEMMLSFLADPKEHGGVWLRNGGLQTLASFDVPSAVPGASEAAMDLMRYQLEAAIGPDLIRWLSDLPSIWQSGNVAVVHAGADPSKPIAEQRGQLLRWGHPDFQRKMRRDGTWVVHGHTIVEEPEARNGRIAIDTGAFATNRLTAVVIGTDSHEFVTT